MSTSNALCTIRKFATLDSTNRYTLDNADLFDNLTLVVADAQSAGRGRLGRTWISPPRVNLYSSLLIKNWPHPPHQAGWLIGLAALDALRETSYVNPWIKWPNDLYIGSRKLAGILCETRLPHLVLGIGVNLNMSASELTQVPQAATSVFAETGTLVDRDKLISRFAFHCTKQYLACLENGISALYQRWKHENSLVGQPARLVTPAGISYVGTVSDLLPNGELELQTSSGKLSFNCGDVSIERSSVLEYQASKAPLSASTQKAHHENP